MRTGPPVLLGRARARQLVEVRLRLDEERLAHDGLRRRRGVHVLAGDGVERLELDEAHDLARRAAGGVVRHIAARSSKAGSGAPYRMATADEVSACGCQPVPSVSAS